MISKLVTKAIRAMPLQRPSPYNARQRQKIRHWGHTWSNSDQGRQDETHLFQKYQGHLDAFRAACERAEAFSHEKTRALAVEFPNDWDAIFRVTPRVRSDDTAHSSSAARFLSVSPSLITSWVSSRLGSSPGGSPSQMASAWRLPLKPIISASQAIVRRLCNDFGEERWYRSAASTVPVQTPTP